MSNSSLPQSLFAPGAAIRWRRHATLTATLALAGVAWLLAIPHMRGMDMGTATRLGSFAFFIAIWVAMMAAMMLPGAAPAASRYAGSKTQVSAAPVFLASYLLVWALV